jgi:hypothetical protein
MGREDRAVLLSTQSDTSGLATSFAPPTPPIGAPIYAQAGSVEPAPADVAVHEPKAPAGIKPA